MNDSDALATLQTFRQALYRCFERRADALLDLTDALLTAGAVLSPAHLSLEAVHRRGWGSLYAALAKGRVNSSALRALLARYPLEDGQPLYAVDCSVWARCAAQTSPERGYYYHSSRHTGGVPVVAGWSYQWISQLSFRRDSWTAPLDVQRVPRTVDVNTAAATQIKALCQRLPAGGPTPLFVFDAGCGCRDKSGSPAELVQGCEREMSKNWGYAVARNPRGWAYGRTGLPEAITDFDSATIAE